MHVTLEVPGRLTRDYTALADAGVCLSVEEALRATLVTGWRFDRGSYHSVRLDLASGESPVQGESGEHDDDTVATEKA